MTGSFLVPIIVPIVALSFLAAWLAVVFWANAHPGWRAHVAAPPWSLYYVGVSEMERSQAARPQRRPGSPLRPAGHEIDGRVALYRVAYEEGQRALDDQQDELNRLRDRAVQFIAFVGAATAFLVGTGLNSSRDVLFYTLAAVASAFSALFIVLLFILLRPSSRRLWNYRLSPETLIADWIETDVPQPSEAQFLRALAANEDQMIRRNETLLGSLRSLYRWFILAGVVQVMWWAALVWVKG